MTMVTVDEFASMRGVSPATIEWMTTPPDARPFLGNYVDALPDVLTSRLGFATLWGAGERAVRYQVARGGIELLDDRVEVHHGDLSWGLRYWDAVLEREFGPHRQPSRARLAALHTIELQAIERELIRLGQLEPDGLVEAQLGCTARSAEWWRRNRWLAD